MLIVRPSQVVKRLQLIAMLLMLGTMSGYSQTVLDRYVCLSETSSEFIYEQIKGRESDDVCNSGTRMHIQTSGDTNIASSITVSRMDNGPHRAKVNIEWNAGMEGIVTIDVYYERREHTGWGDCDWEPWTYMYTYKVYKLNVNPSGGLTGLTTLGVANDVTEKQFSLSYLPSSSYPKTRKVVKIKYHNGYQVVEKSISNNSGFYTATPVEYYKTGFGPVQFTTELQDDCGVWYPGPSQTLTLQPSCYQDIASGIVVTASGPDILSYPEGYQVNMNVTYSLSVTGSKDFLSHYEWNAQDGGEDFAFDQNSFMLLKGLGSYRLIATKKPGREICPAIPTLAIFVGGRDVTIEDECPIILPDDFQDPDFRQKFGYEIDPNDVVLQHFAATIISKRSILVKPGLRLTLGAELILDRPQPAPDPEDPDLAMNFVEHETFDEYGFTLGASRSYFDDRGMPLQTQAKNLSQEVILATAMLYDAQGRQSISTLAAPVSASTVRTVEGVCGAEQTGESTRFQYKSDFVTSSTGVYNYTNFDGAKENNPDPVASNTPGTLGWYYSENNGTATGDFERMNEPLTATTAYPYMRTLYHHDGSGDTRSTTQPGDQHRAGLNRSAEGNTESVPGDDPHLLAYLSMREQGLDLPPLTASQIEGNFIRSVSIDANQRKTITYGDKSGSSIIVLYFGSSSVPQKTSYQFYDQSGRLVVSVSPNGVSHYNGSNFSEIDKTVYHYNHKGWLLKLSEPDAGETEYLYRKDGKLRFSQTDAQEEKGGAFSYTNYDRVGRPIESGEYKGELSFDALTGILEQRGFESGLTGGERSSWIRTYYDFPANELSELFGDESLVLPLERSQRFVHGAVSCSKNENITTWYSYDERGRVEWTVQQIHAAPKEFSLKTLDYRYGPTGAVRECIYQKDEADQFSHYYEYNADGRLHKVYTTTALLEYNTKGELTNPDALKLQATYHYYLHGPLKRVELENKLQGIDYVYTVDGMLKAINHHDPAKDPGGDGGSNGFKPDAFGMTLEYYPSDYSSRGFDETEVTLPSYDTYYNGVVKAQRWHSPVQPGSSFGYAFRYDDQYQLTESNWASVIGGSMIFTDNRYRESVTEYDDNGNIQGLNRYDNLGNSIADFSYHYPDHLNKLTQITTGSSAVRSYEYDATGRLIEEEKDGNTRYMEYDPSGKVLGVYQVKNADGTLGSPVVKYGYDERGFRLYKTAYNEAGTEKLTTTWYIRDATGNVTATYEEDHSVVGASPVCVEVPVYGSGRLGMFKPAYKQTLYEVVDHLGNVRAVIAGDVQTTLMATMEDERSEKEQQDFFGMRSTVSARDINHTSSIVELEGETDYVKGNKVIRLNNRPKGRYNPNPIGGGTMLWVHPGDTIRAEVYAKYLKPKPAKRKKFLLGLSGLLKNASPIAAAAEMKKAFQVLTQPEFLALPVWGKLDEAQPPAFLNGLMFDKDMKLQSFDFDQVSESARIDPAKGKTPHEKLELEFIAEKEGYLYIYVSNESKEDLDVYFDDLTVNHVYGTIVSGGDYYPYGLAIEDRQITTEKYRHGYQGQFAEKDEETGWNHFELREYDAEIGRWTAVDPMRQYQSPYIGLGNNPVNGTDPTGGEESPYYDEMGNFLGVDENGFSGEVRIMSQMTWNNLNVGNDKGYISSEAGYKSSVGLANSNISLSAISSILTHIVSALPDVAPNIMYSQFNLLYNNKISVYNDLTGEGFNDPKKSWLNNTVVKDGRIKVTAVTSQMEFSVEAIQLTYGMHEFQGHGYIQGIQKRNDFKHSDVYDLEKNHPLFKKTSTDYQQNVIKMGNFYRQRND